MGYACPVCGTPQSDAEHLANHLAFTAMLGDDDHEEWLDDHAPGWSDEGEAELADRVADYADEEEFPQVFEDTTPHDHGHGDEPRGGDLFEDELERANTRGRGSMAGGAGGSGGGADAGALDPEARRILQEAREMTEEMLDDGDECDEE
ncbi:DUF5810 domain-containing protein [Halorussus salilacus]|uniref:DUF5810 domain-containing protein n=1 Tax=Halorussus salilacus TaxID=2953750 RepID=UPI00209DBA6E|nr:DUF5810 domain-containing protein [Halorussus salilacus]USZ69557.1 DUF5810 domain-containing protein [Halorussus salilacus]